MGNNKELKAMMESANRNQAPSSIKDLVLDEGEAADLSEVTDLLGAHTALQSLSLDSVGLTSLKGLPSLPALKKLSVGNNKIAEGLDLLAKQCPKLETLNLANNQTIKSFDSLAPLKQLTHLKTLVLDGCEISKDDKYLQRIRELLPQVTKVDGKAQKFEGASEEDDEDDDDEEGSDEEDGPGLAHLLNDVEDEDDDEDFQEEEGSDDSEEEDTDDEEGTPQKGSNSKGTKRKRGDEDDESGDD